MSAILGAEAIFEKLRADLAPYVRQNLNGTVHVARDPFNVVELLGESPGKFRVILSWGGEKIASDPRSMVVEHALTAIVSHNRGLGALMGGNRSAARADDPALMTLARQVRDRMLTALFPNDGTTTGTLRYVSTQPFPVEIEGMKLVHLDAYEMTFSLTAAGARFAEDQYRRV